LEVQKKVVACQRQEKEKPGYEREHNAEEEPNSENNACWTNAKDNIGNKPPKGRNKQGWKEEKTSVSGEIA